MKSRFFVFAARVSPAVPAAAAWCLAFSCAGAYAESPSSSAEPTAPEVIEAMEQANGVTPGARRNHTKGLCATGQFTGTDAATRYSRSALFTGAEVPVVARFSLAGGNPAASDATRSPRGLALQFRLPGGALHHMAMLNVPVFGAARPRTFYDLMIALRPDPATGKPDPERLRMFRASHPDSLAQAAYLGSHNPPDNYASSAYWGIHTFRWIDAQNHETMVRWKFVPRDGEQFLSDEALKNAGTDFLEQKLLARMAQGPVRWDMWVSVGQPGDPVDDPTQAWPADRYSFVAGTLTLTAASSQKGAPCEAINFDPMVMADGIAPTDDPVLRFRSAAYAVSFGKRLSGQ